MEQPRDEFDLFTSNSLNLPLNRDQSPFFLENTSVYQFTANLQGGSFGQVILAYDQVKNADVAIKVIPVSSEEPLSWAKHELSILKQLAVDHHKNICQLLDAFRTQNYMWLVFEYCANGDLYDYVADQSNDSKPLHFKTLIKELVESLNYSHSKGIFHRDIKPENVLIDSSKSIKLTDWGLATTRLMASRSGTGTEKYMAPEAFEEDEDAGSGKVTKYNTKYSDYWSLGITLLYVLFKHCPWKKAELSDSMFREFRENPWVLFDWYPTLTNFGYDCIMSLLQVDPEKRSLDQFYQQAVVENFGKAFARNYEDLFGACSYSVFENENEIFEQNDVQAGTDHHSCDQTRDLFGKEELLFGMEIDGPVLIDHQQNQQQQILDDYDDSDSDRGSYIDEIFDEPRDHRGHHENSLGSYCDEVLTPATLESFNGLGNELLCGEKKPIFTEDINLLASKLDSSVYLESLASRPGSLRDIDTLALKPSNSNSLSGISHSPPLPTLSHTPSFFSPFRSQLNQLQPTNQKLSKKIFENRHFDTNLIKSHQSDTTKSMMVPKINVCHPHFRKMDPMTSWQERKKI